MQTKYVNKFLCFTEVTIDKTHDGLIPHVQYMIIDLELQMN